jgi:hypothetical protein
MPRLADPSVLARVPAPRPGQVVTLASSFAVASRCGLVFGPGDLWQ